jgi:OHCU decarboxylase
MRSLPSSYDLVVPRSLERVLTLMAKEPGVWTPLAGGTEVMVQFGAGKLATQRLVSIRELPELRTITENGDELHIGAGCSYTDLRRNALISSEFPMLSIAASWTGSIANQNRGTLGGNIVNASPAADSLPALLVYEADLILISARGERRVAYVDFHTGYKRTLLQPDELIRAIVLPRRYAGYVSCSRKVGPRNAQAISKLCMAALAKTSGSRIEEIRVAFGSMAPVPLRLRETERVLNGSVWSEEVLRAARRTLKSEVSPIDDIRSTREYRIAVAGNLLEEFLRSLFLQRESAVLKRWNALSAEDAAAEVLSCCGSQAWANAVAAARPYLDERSLLERAREIWRGLSAEDWMEAFRSHPRIGERHAERTTTAASAAWSAGEQRDVQLAEDDVKRALVDGNRKYEERFGRIFIVCAAGKKPAEILAILERRLGNDDAMELKESADEQEQILQLRLKKWLSQQEAV